MNMYNLVSLAGVFALLALAWLCSAKRGKVQFRTVAGGLIIQVVFALLLFVLPAGRDALLLCSRFVSAILDAARAGLDFCFGPLAIPPGEKGSLGFILLFQGLATVVFFAALVECLYFLRVMPFILKWFSRIFTRVMRTSGAESLCAASNIFVGIESATTVRPYLERMTVSELCTILTAGLATIASSVLGLYVLLLQDTFPHIAGHLVSASLLSAPAALIMSKLLLPETGEPETLGLAVEPAYERDRNLIEAILHGARAGGQLVFGIVVMLLAVIGLVALVNAVLGTGSDALNAWTGWSLSLRLQDVLAYVFYPLVLIIGVPPVDAMEVARLLGERIILTEVPAYQHLGAMIDSGTLQHPRSILLAGYALCGFAHIPSIAIFVGGISALAPGQSRNLSRVALRALAAATLACLLTAAIAGTFFSNTTFMLQTSP